MDKIKFAVLINYITMCSNNMHLDAEEISEIDKIINEGSGPDKALCANVDNLMEAMNKGELIQTIKAYRTLTGMTLKDSKEAVERVMVGINQRQELRTIASDMRRYIEGDKLYTINDDILKRWLETLDKITG